MPPDVVTPAVQTLQRVFGYPAFRFGQADAVDAVLSSRDALVLLPTGAGKSLCYQVPSLLMFDAGQGTTIVVSPLIALMKDQVDGLTGRGVSVGALNSQQDDDEQVAVVSRFLRGELAMLYVSPERAAMAGFRRMLGRVKIALLAIDEAHCMSQWGHDFRPEYMQLHELRLLPALKSVPVIALTATATPRVMTEIASALSLHDPVTVRGDFSRANLQFAVLHCSKDAERLAATIDAAEAAGLRGGAASGRAVIYCSTRKKAEDVAQALAKAGFAAGHYHAGRTALARDRAQRGFATGRTRVLVATNAFGMGIDLPDVRLIVHFQAPGSLEAYYQEAGRAGRDGDPATCVLLFGAGDMVTQRRLQSGKTGGAESRAADALVAVERYAHSARCRQQMICEHFTGLDDARQCQRCDVCVDPTAVNEKQDHRDAKKQAAAEVVAAEMAAMPSHVTDTVLAAAAVMPRPVGKGNLAKALRGSRAKTVSVSGLLTIPQFGLLHQYSEESLTALIENLITARKLERRGKKYPTVWLRGRETGRARDGANKRTVDGRKARIGSDKVRGVPFGTTPSGQSGSSPRGSRGGSIARELESYRRKQARELKWKSYMIFQRRTILAIEKDMPGSREALAKIPGMGPAKIARFGDDVLAVVKRYL